MNPRIAAVGLITLSLLVAGCSGGSSKGGGAVNTTAPSAGVPRVFAVESYLTQGSPSTTALTFALSAPADPGSVSEGVTVFAYEDRDQNPGGTFRSLPGAANLDASGTTLSFTPSRALRDGRQVRVLLTRGVRGAGTGVPLERGAASASISFRQQVPDAVF